MLRRWLWTTLLLSGCLEGTGARAPEPKLDAGGEVDADSPDPTPTPTPTPSPSPSPSPRGILAQPRHGVIVAGPTQQAIEISGFLPEPGAQVSIQTLGSSADLGSFTTIATATAATAPREPGQYAFSLQLALPGWRQGGIVRVRAVDARGVPLATFDRDAEACFVLRGATTWAARLGCAVPLSSVVLVSPSPSPADATPGPRYLDLRGQSVVAETQAYYQTIVAPATLAAFRTRHGLDGTGAISAYYYNAADLGIGRGMHCARGPSGTLACAVSNFGRFGGDAADALAGALTGATTGDAGAFATVAMVSRAGGEADFMVYDAAGNLATSAPLDTHGDNTSIPNNCLNCHGGTYEARTHLVSGARFLPFDPAAFHFGAAAPYRQVDQEEALRRLNQLVRGAAPVGPLTLIIDSLYGPGGVDRAGTAAAPDPIPAGWTEPRAAQVYRHAIRPYCMGCHATARGIDLSTAEALRTLGPRVQTSVCGRPGDVASHTMPNAEVTLQRFWASPARAFLVGWLGLTGDCSP